jgi:hypothetical protein
LLFSIAAAAAAAIENNQGIDLCAGAKIDLVLIDIIDKQLEGIGHLACLEN